MSREQVSEAIDIKGLVPVSPKNRGWFARLRPTFAVPVFAALLLFIGYQNGVTIPNLKQASTSVVIGEGAKSFSLLSAGSRGEGTLAPKIAVGARDDFRLEVDAWQFFDRL